MAEENKYEDVEKELQTRFALLPKEIQEVILSSDYQTKLFDIAKKYKLTYEQLGMIEMETTMVLLGMIPPANFGPGLGDQIGKKGDELKQIVDDISAAAFTPIHNSLMKVYQEDAEDNEAETPEEQKNSNSIQKNETDILAKTGISIVGDKTAKEMSILPGSLPRSDVLSGIQNPPKMEARKLNDLPRPMAAEMPKMQPATPTVPTLSTPTPTVAAAPIVKPITFMPPMPAATSPKPPAAPSMPTPPAMPKPGMIDQKLSGATGQTMSTSAYVPLSSSKMPTPPMAPKPPTPLASDTTQPTPKKGDAYREPIE